MYQAAMGQFHPVATADAPMRGQVWVVAEGTPGARVEDTVPLYTAGWTREPVPATAPHRWFQVVPAGHA